MQEKIKILKVRFDKTTLKEAAETAVAWAKQDKKRYITTPNPEILLEAQKNHKFHDILNKSDLNIPDGTGILWAAKYLESVKNTVSKSIKILKWLISIASILFYPPYIRKPLPQRVTGTDLMQEICRLSAKENLKIFLLGADEGIAEKTKEILQDKYEGLKITGTHAGTPSIKDEKKIQEIISRTQPDILFVAYGAPAQEIWIHRNLKKLKTVSLAIGIGGAFDFIAGKRKRAPRFMQRIGMEWLYRLIQQPSRIRRIYNATIKFSLKVLKKSF
ncbi:MAG: WecB/TagA/CpsF family glycosyltransferase [Candidatus Peregrinibacteria bacterium]